MLITFFDRRGLIYVHEMPKKVNVNRTTYKAALVMLLNVHIPWKRPQYQNENFKLHMDNVQLHIATTVRNFLAKRGVEIVSHPPYSPDLALSDFLFGIGNEKIASGPVFQ